MFGAGEWKDEEKGRRKEEETATVPEERASCLLSLKEACERAESWLLCSDRQGCFGDGHVCVGVGAWVWFDSQSRFPGVKAGM